MLYLNFTVELQNKKICKEKGRLYVRYLDVQRVYIDNTQVIFGNGAQQA